MVHHIVLTTFVGPCPEGLECRHLDGVKTNCRLSNLAWGTVTENAEDRKKHRNFGPHVRLYTIDDETEPLKEWSRRLSIPYTCLYKRIFTLGMTFEEAISRPYQGVSSNGGHWTNLKRRRS